MFEYKIEHCRKNVLQDTLDRVGKEGYKLHSIFQEASGYMLVLEAHSFYTPALLPVEEILFYGTDKTNAKRKTRKPVNLGDV